jgi:RNA polymerase sigma-70 factor (ECF subfamily)
VADEDALLTAFKAHNGALRRIAWAYAGRDGEEEDLHQEILAEAWRSFPSFREDSGIGTWLYRVAINTALTWKRRTKKHSAGRIPLDARSGEGATRVDPIGNAAAETGAAILADFLGTLDGPNHTVLILYMEGLTQKEIAEVTGLSASAIGVRIHRMKQSFTEKYLER